MRNTIALKGTYDIKIFGADGKLKSSETVKNLVTNAGKAQLALLAGDAAAVPFTYLAVGTSSTTPVVANTTLGAEITDSGLARAAATISRTTVTVSNDTYRAVYSWSVSGTKTVEEVGVFNASPSGTMLSRALTGSKALVSGDTLQITYNLTFS